MGRARSTCSWAQKTCGVLPWACCYFSHCFADSLAGLGERAGQSLSDHHPVSLCLSVFKEGVGRSTRKRARFDVSQWFKFARLFQEEGSTFKCKIVDAAAMLADGASATTVMDTMGKGMGKAIDAAFGVGVDARAPGEHAPWWTEECADARRVMLQQLDAWRRACRLDPLTAKKGAYSASRTHYVHLCRDAQESYRVQVYDRFFEECRTNPRALWRKLSEGEREECRIIDVE